MNAADNLNLLLPGFQCPAPPKFPPGPIIRQALVEGRMRWVLRRAWGPGPAILWCGLNPSNADDTRDDPTMLREIGFSYRWGFGSLVKINIYPLITPHPEKLKGWLDRGRRARGIGVVECILKGNEFARAEVCKIDVRVAAWGAGVSDCAERDFMDAMCDADDVFPAWKCLGRNANGSPVHTLARGKHRVPDNATLIDYPFPKETPCCT